MQGIGSVRENLLWRYSTVSNCDLTSLGSTELTYQTSTRLPVLYWEALADRLSPAQSSDLAPGINLSCMPAIKNLIGRADGFASDAERCLLRSVLSRRTAVATARYHAPLDAPLSLVALCSSALTALVAMSRHHAPALATSSARLKPRSTLSGSCSYIAFIILASPFCQGVAPSDFLRAKNNWARPMTK